VGALLFVQNFCLEPLLKQFNSGDSVRARPLFPIEVVGRYIAGRDARDVLQVFGRLIDVVHRGGGFDVVVLH
jgi:hypothetical protein